MLMIWKKDKRGLLIGAFWVCYHWPGFKVIDNLISLNHEVKIRNYPSKYALSDLGR